MFGAPPHQKLLLQVASQDLVFFCSFGVVCGFSKGKKEHLVLQFRLFQIYSLNCDTLVFYWHWIRLLIVSVIFKQIT